MRQSIVPVLARGEAMIAHSREPAAELLTKLMLSIPMAVAGSPVSAIPKLVLSEARNFPDLARFYLEEVVRRGQRLLKGIIERGIAQGEFRPVDKDHVFFTLMSPLLVAMLWKHSLEPFDSKRLDVQALCRAHLDVVLRGLRNPEASP